MPDHISSEAARKVAQDHECRGCVLILWDGLRTHVVTWGDNEHDSDLAAHTGNWVKKGLGWPASLQAESPKVTALKNRIDQLAAERDAITKLCYRTIESGDGDSYFRIVLDTLDRQEKSHDTEEGAIAAVRKAAGLGPEDVR